MSYVTPAEFRDLLRKHPILRFAESALVAGLKEAAKQVQPTEPLITLWFCTQCHWNVYRNLHWDCYLNHRDEVKPVNLPLRSLK